MIFLFSYNSWAHQCLKKQVKSLSIVSCPLYPPRRGLGVTYIIFIYIIYKKAHASSAPCASRLQEAFAPQVRLAPQGLKRLLRLNAS